MTKKKILIYNNKKYENFDLLLKDMSNDDLLDLREALTDKFAIYSAFDEKEERFLKKFYIVKSLICGSIFIASFFVDEPLKYVFLGGSIGPLLYFPQKEGKHNINFQHLSKIYADVEEEIYSRKIDNDIFPEFFAFPSKKEIDEKVKKWDDKQLKDIIGIDLTIE